MCVLYNIFMFYCIYMYVTHHNVTCKPYNAYASGNAQKNILIKSNQIISYIYM